MGRRGFRGGQKGKSPHVYKKSKNGLGNSPGAPTEGSQDPGQSGLCHSKGPPGNLRESVASMRKTQKQENDYERSIFRCFQNQEGSVPELLTTVAKPSRGLSA